MEKFPYLGLIEMTYLSLEDGDKKDHSGWEIRAQGFEYLFHDSFNQVLFSFKSVERGIDVGVFPSQVLLRSHVLHQKPCLPDIMSTIHSDKWSDGEHLPFPLSQGRSVSVAVVQQFLSSQKSPRALTVVSP